MSKNQCEICEYRTYCFWPLKFLKANTNDLCRQYRKMKEYKVKNETARIDNKVETVQPVFSGNTVAKIG